MFLSPPRQAWLKQVAYVIFDEIHSIGNEDGAKVTEQQEPTHMHCLVVSVVVRDDVMGCYMVRHMPCAGMSCSDAVLHVYICVMLV